MIYKTKKKIKEKKLNFGCFRLFSVNVNIQYTDRCYGVQISYLP